MILVTMPKFLTFKQKRKEINFFSIKKKKKTVALAGILIVLIPIVLLGAMFSVYTYNKYEIDRLNADLATEARNLAAINLKEKEPILERANIKRDIFATYFEWVDSLNTQLKHFDVVPSQLIVDMNTASKSVVCTSIAAKENSLVFTGTAPSTEAIAEYQSSCSKIFGVSDVFVTSITKKDSTKKVVKKKTVVTDVYEFEMTVKFGAQNDTETQNN